MTQGANPNPAPPANAAPVPPPAPTVVGAGSPQPQAPIPELPKPREAAKPDKVEAKTPGTDDKKDDEKPREKRRVALADDDEIPDDADVLELSKAGLKKRLQRFSRSQLKEHFGTDDVDQIKKDVQEAAEFRKKAEEQRKAELSELQREKEEREKERKRADELEQKLRDQEEKVEFAEYTRTTVSVLESKIDPDYVDVEMIKMQRDIAELSDKEANRLSRDPALFKKWVENWTEERLEAKPKIAKGYDAEAEKAKAKGEDQAQQKKKITLNTGHGSGPGNEPPPAKTARPNQANSMTPAEVKQALQKIGKSAHR